MAKKYYVIWKGKKTGVFSSWDEVKKYISGYPNAKYKSFSSQEEANRAYEDPSIVKPTEKKKKAKYYVVWDGPRSKVYTDWDEARAALKGLSMDHLKTFGSKVLAERALQEGPENYKGKDFRKTKDLSESEIEEIGSPIELSLAVDAACNEMTGVMEYQGVWTFDKEQVVFRKGPYEGGSNNVGEFLALVHGLAYLKAHKDEKMHELPIYSDSRIAMGWIKAKKCRTKSVGSQELRQLISRAETWLQKNSYKNPILKWETKVWGEIPADFGRK
ncbi:ribonuclease H1 domain-containing protein [Parvicella tangerina]|uniref:Ribonuclease H n=1 Tax=Parvicella tangerina TaxID=2829795 RepID=A0A916JKJ4_9FLAO|nr:viroplasmin family protein [Parvicella tangerina]CAG5077654.1 hypothetical protein CRYO30217_00450 [Parvicella tangerina]